MSDRDTRDPPRPRLTVRARLTDLFPADLLSSFNDEEFANSILRQAEIASSLLQEQQPTNSTPPSARATLAAAGSAQMMLASAVNSIEAYAAAFPERDSSLVAGFPRRSAPLMTRQRLLEIVARRNMVFSPDLSTSIMHGTVEQTVDAINLANPPPAELEEFALRTLVEKIQDFEAQNETIEDLTNDARANRHSRAGFQLNRISPRYINEMVRHHCATKYPDVFDYAAVRDMCVKVQEAVRASTLPLTEDLVDGIVTRTSIMARTQMENIRVKILDNPDDPAQITLRLESGDRQQLERILPFVAVEQDDCRAAKSRARPSPAAAQVQRGSNLSGARLTGSNLSGARLTPALMRQLEMQQSSPSETIPPVSALQPFKPVYFAIPANRSVVDFFRIRRVPLELMEKSWSSQMNLRPLTSTAWGCETVPEEVRVFIYQQVFVALLRRMSEAINACWHTMKTKVTTGELKVMNCDPQKKKSMIDKWWGDFQAAVHTFFFNDFTLPMQASAMDSSVFDVLLRFDTSGLLEELLTKHIKKLCVIIYCGQGTDADYVRMEHQCANIVMKGVAFRFMEFFQIKDLKYQSKRMTRAGEPKSKTPLFAVMKRTCAALIDTAKHLTANEVFTDWRVKVFGRARADAMLESNVSHELGSEAAAGAARSAAAGSAQSRPARSAAAGSAQARSGAARPAAGSAQSRSGAAAAVLGSAMPTHPRPGRARQSESSSGSSGSSNSSQATSAPSGSSNSSQATSAPSGSSNSSQSSSAPSGSSNSSQSSQSSSGNSSPVFWRPPVEAAKEASPNLCRAMSRILEVSIETRRRIVQFKVLRKALRCWFGLYHGPGIPEARYLKIGFKGFLQAACLRLVDRTLTRAQPLAAKYHFLSAWKSVLALKYMGSMIACKGKLRLTRRVMSAWSRLAELRASAERLGRVHVLSPSLWAWRAQAALGRRVSAMHRRGVGLRALRAWFFAAHCSAVVAMKVRVRAEAYARCSFARLQSYARSRLDMARSLRSLALCRSLRRLFLAWDEAVVEASLQRYQELAPLKAQLDRAQKRLGDAEVRAATLQRDRDSFKQILGRSEERNKQLEASEVKLQERLARTQEKLVQTENLRAKAMTRAQQAEARAAKLLAGAGSAAVAPVAAGGSAAVPVAAGGGFVSTDSLVDCVQCPITMQIPADPVTAEDNFTYDRAAIEDHFRRRGAVSPMTNEPLGSTRLRTCAFARQVISALFPGHQLAPARD